MTGDGNRGAPPRTGFVRELLLDFLTLSVYVLRNVGDLIASDVYSISMDYAVVVDRLVFCGGVIAGIYLGVPLHELVHRAGDVLTGGTFGPVYIDPSFGGSFYRMLLPGLFTDQSNNPLSILGAGSTTTDYAPTGTALDYLHSFALLAAPSAILTPAGMALLKGGLKWKSPAVAGLGFSLAWIPLFDVTDLAGIFMAFVHGPSFTFLQAVSALGIWEIAAYLLAGAMFAGLCYDGSKRLIGRLDRSRTTPQELWLFGKDAEGLFDAGQRRSIGSARSTHGS